MKLVANIVKVTAEIWIDLDRLFAGDLGWELSEDKKEDATYPVEQTVDALRGLKGLHITTTKARGHSRRRNQQRSMTDGRANN
jgi:hypothetical protein